MNCKSPRRIPGSSPKTAGEAALPRLSQVLLQNLSGGLALSRFFCPLKRGGKLRLFLGFAVAVINNNAIGQHPSVFAAQLGSLWHKHHDERLVGCDF